MEKLCDIRLPASMSSIRVEEASQQVCSHRSVSSWHPGKGGGHWQGSGSPALEPMGKMKGVDTSQTIVLLFSCSVMSDSFRPHGLQHTRLPCPSLSPGVCSNSCPLSWWYHPPSHPLSSPSPPALNLSQHYGLFQWVNSSHQVGKVLEFQHQSFQWIFRVDFL